MWTNEGLGFMNNSNYGVSHAAILLLTSEGDASTISRTKSSNYRDLNDTSKEFKELCKSLIDSEQYMFDPSKDVYPGVIYKNETTNMDERTMFDNENQFHPFDMSFNTYTEFVWTCKNILSHINRERKSFDHINFFLNMSHPILLWSGLLRSLDHWITVEFDKVQVEKGQNYTLNCYEALILLSGLRKQLSIFPIVQECVDCYHRTQAMNLIMKECCLDRDTKSLAKDIDISSLKKDKSYKDHYFFKKLENVFLVCRNSQDIGFADKEKDISENRLKLFATTKIISEEKNKCANKSQPTSNHSEFGEIVDLALRHKKSSIVNIYMNHFPSAKELIEEHVPVNERQKKMKKNSFKNIENLASGDPLPNDCQLEKGFLKELHNKEYLTKFLTENRLFMRMIIKHLINSPNFSKFYHRNDGRNKKELQQIDIYEREDNRYNLTKNGKIFLDNELMMFDSTRNIETGNDMDWYGKIYPDSLTIDSKVFRQDAYLLEGFKKRFKNDLIKKYKDYTNIDIENLTKTGRILTVYTKTVLDVVMAFTDHKQSLNELKEYIEKNPYVSSILFLNNSDQIKIMKT